MGDVLGMKPIMRRDQAFLDDVEAGSEIPPHTVSFNVVKMAMFAAVSGDFYPSHYDNKWAIDKSHHPAATVHGLHVTTHLSQLLTNWIAPDGALKSFSSRVQTQTFDGDTVTMKGRVSKKYTKDSENYLECEIWGEKQDGTVVVTGSATVTLPSRS
jgi:acyl dehydratase